MNKTDRAKKVAETRAKNAERAMREAEQLANETKEGRGAKKKALMNAVWKPTSTRGNNQQALLNNNLGRSGKEQKRKKQGHSDNPCSESSDEGQKQDHRAHVTKKRSESVSVSRMSDTSLPNGPEFRRPPSAALIPTEESELEDNLSLPAVPIKKPLNQQRTKKTKTCDDDSELDNGSNSDDSDSELGDDSEGNGDLSSSEDAGDDDTDLRSQLPRFVGLDDEAMGETSHGAEDAFEIPGEDIEMMSKSRPSSRMSSRSARSGTAPPTINFDISNDENDSDLKIKQAKSAPKSRGRRALAFTAEQPKTKLSRSRGKEKVNRRAENLFKIPSEDIDMMSMSRSSSRMSSPSARSARSARSGTAPPTTDFDISNDENDSDLKTKQNKSALKSRGHRALAFTAEQPKIKLSRSRGKEEATKQWSSSASLNLPPSGKPSDLGLRDQHPLLQSIIRSAIQKVTDEMVLKQAWPEAKERPLYEKAILMDACRELELEILDNSDHDHSDIKEIKKRIKVDPGFVKALANVALDRLSTLRAPAKREAEKHIPYYKLGLGKECEERVGSLFLHHSYIFPGSWGLDEHDSNTWKPKHNEPYFNAAIIETLKAAFFAKPSSLGNQYLNKFISTIPDAPDERELSIPLVALGATGVYAGLYEFRSGFHKELQFSGNTFIGAYSSHVTSLEKLKIQKPTKFHEVMSNLYKLVICVNHDSGNGSNDDNDIFSIIDL